MRSDSKPPRSAFSSLPRGGCNKLSHRFSAPRSQLVFVAHCRRQLGGLILRSDSVSILNFSPRGWAVYLIFKEKRLGFQTFPRSEFLIFPQVGLRFSENQKALADTCIPYVPPRGTVSRYSFSGALVSFFAFSQEAVESIVLKCLSIGGKFSDATTMILEGIRFASFVSFQGS